MIRLYKEGEGIWARGALACLFGGTGLVASVRLSAFLEGEGWLQDSGFNLLGWYIGTANLLSIAVLLPFVIAGVLLYNRPKVADFLIDTESEMKTKVTWPTRKETANNSVVVVVTCIILGIWIAMADTMFYELKNWFYN